MVIDTDPRTRRAVLLGALVGVAASIATAAGRANPVSAANTDPVLAGSENHATSYTSIDTDTSDADAIIGSSRDGNGLVGTSRSNSGVHGSSVNLYGLRGNSDLYIAINGDSVASDQPAIAGRSRGANCGVQGFSGTTALPTSPVKTGFFGSANQDASSVGVLGASSAGKGVSGTSHSGPGVYGFSGAGLAPAAPAKTGVFGAANQDATSVGVLGRSTHGTGVAAVTSTGVAVRASGGSGRGGVFAGGKAQLRLVPSGAGNHPATGVLGDLFLDKSGRLWFCKGGATWVKLA